MGINHFKDPKAFMQYSDDMRDVYKNINYYNPNKENKILIVFDDMIADMIQNKKLNSIVTELLFEEENSTFLLFLLPNHTLKFQKMLDWILLIFFIANILNKRELQQIAINQSSDISTEDFINIYRKCTAEPYLFFVNDNTLASNNPLRFRKNLFGHK